LKKQRNCKICNSPEWLSDAFVIAYHAEHQTYEQIIEMFARHGISLNIYNCSVHKHRHLENRDFLKAEETKARWDEIDAKIAEKTEFSK
jgi:hypothetical protein